MKSKHFLPIAVILFIMVFSLYSIFNAPIEKFNLPVKFSVGESFGVSINESNLDFGRIIPGSSITKTIKITNNYAFPAKVGVFSTKNINKFIISETDFLIFPGEERKIQISLIIPKETPLGDYSGEMKIEIRKA